VRIIHGKMAFVNGKIAFYQYKKPTKKDIKNQYKKLNIYCLVLNFKSIYYSFFISAYNWLPIVFCLDETLFYMKTASQFYEAMEITEKTTVLWNRPLVFYTNI
jgi:hypothetical protein